MGRMSSLISELQMGNHVVSRQVVRPFEEFELDQEADPDDAPPELVHQAGRRLRGPAGGEQVVDDDDGLARLDRIFMNLEYCRAILERVGFRNLLAGQLALLAYGNEAGVEQVGERPSEDEAARLDPDDQLDGLAAIGPRHDVHGLAKGASVLEEGRNVLEEHPFFGEVAYVADLLSQGGQHGRVIRHAE